MARSSRCEWKKRFGWGQRRAWPNHRPKLTGAAILVFRASTSLQAAPAAKPERTAEEMIALFGGGVMDSNTGGSQRLERLTLVGICVATVSYVGINFAVSPQHVMTESNALAEFGAPPVLGGCLAGFWALRSSKCWRAFLRGLIGTFVLAIILAIAYGIIHDLIDGGMLPGIATAFNQLVIYGPVGGLVFGIVYSIRVARRAAT